MPQNRTIRREGLLFQLAYGWSNDEKKVSEVSLCKLVWRLPLGVPLFAFAAILLAVYYGILVPANFLVARRPDDNRNSETMFKPFERWPLQIKGHRVWPLWPLLLVGLLGFLAMNLEAAPVQAVAGWALTLMPSTLSWALVWEATLNALVVAGLAGYSMIIILLMAIGVFWAIPSVLRQGLRELEFVRLFVAWMKARKEGLCPILTVVDD